MRWGLVGTTVSLADCSLWPRTGTFGKRTPAVVVSGDTAGVAKPDPAPMHWATRAIDIAPTRCLYVGDAERDIQAGRAVGMRTVLVNWGYIDAAEMPEKWGADHAIDAPDELVSLCRQYRV